MAVEWDKYDHIGDIEFGDFDPVSFEADSAVISVPAGFSPKKHNIVVKSTLDAAISVQLVGGLDTDFSVPVEIETAVAVAAGDTVAQTGMIQTERDFPCYKLVVTATPPVPTKNKCEVYYAPFE